LPYVDRFGGWASAVKDIPTLIKEGFDPIHAVWLFMQNLTSHFAEGVFQLPEMKRWARAVGKAEDEYMPLFGTTEIH